MDTNLATLLASSVVAALIGGVVGALASRINDRQTQLREMMISTAVELSGGLGSGIAWLQRLQPKVVPFDAPLDQTRLGRQGTEVLNAVGESLVHTIERLIPPASILFSLSAAGAARQCSIHVSYAAAALSELMSEEPEDPDMLSRPYGESVKIAKHNLSVVERVTADELWASPGPLRRQWRRRRDARAATEAVRESEEGLVRLAADMEKMSSSIQAMTRVAQLRLAEFEEATPEDRR